VKTVEFLANADLMALMAASEMCVTGGGGGCVGQVFAQHKAAVVVPLGGTDQRTRLARGQAAGLLLAAEPTCDAIASAVKCLLSDPDRRKKMALRLADAGYCNSAPLAMEALARLLPRNQGPAR
jgi:UDP-N-acetylglucosamine:LPS N-acetylglucosamine transferase